MLNRLQHVANYQPTQIDYGVDEIHLYHVKRTAIQVAELELSGNTLVCDRNTPFDFTLKPGS